MIKPGLEGVEECLQTLSQFAQWQYEAGQEALEYVLRLMINYAKENGPWVDRSANLRNSISINYQAMKEWAADTPEETLRNLKEQNETPVLRIQGDGYEGILSVGMNYAIWVETTEGYWVLQGSIDKFEPMIEKYFKGIMSVEKFNPDHVARVAYQKFLGKKG